MKNNNNIYTSEQWEKDRTFKAEPMQQIEQEIYFHFLNCMPPLNINKDFAYNLINNGFHLMGAFLMSEPYSHNGQGKALYMAFGHDGNNYYYLGLSTR